MRASRHVRPATAVAGRHGVALALLTLLLAHPGAAQQPVNAQPRATPQPADGGPQLAAGRRLSSSLPTAAPTTGTPEAPIVMEPIVVTAARAATPLKDLPASVTVMEQREIQHANPLALDDLLRTEPGFNTFRRSSSLVTAPADDPEAQGVSLRGIGPGGASRALVLVDGLPMNDAFGGWIYWGEIPPDDVERIEIVRGGSANLWGNVAEAGAIHVITRTPERTGCRVKLAGGTLGTADGSMAIDDVDAKMRLGFRGRFFRTAGFDIVRPSQRGPIDHDAGSTMDVCRLTLDDEVSPRLTLTLRASAYSEARDGGTALRTSDAGRTLVALGASSRGGDGQVWTLGLFSRSSLLHQNFSTANVARTAETLTQSQEVPSSDGGGSLTWTRGGRHRHAIAAGTDARFIEGESRDSLFDPAGFRVTDRQVAQGRQAFLGSFLSDDYSASRSLRVLGSIRVDSFRSYAGNLLDVRAGQPAATSAFAPRDQCVVNPALSARYALRGGVALRAGASGGFRAPTLAELYRRSSVETLVLHPNPELAPERIETHEAGLETPESRRLSGSITFYRSTLRSPISHVVTAQDAQGNDSERTRFNLGLARSQGLEVEARLALSHDWTLSGEYLYTEARLLDSPPDETLVGKRLALVPQNSGNVALHYAKRRGVDALLRARFVGKQFEDSDNGDLQPAYALVDLSLNAPFPRHWGGGHQGEVFLAAQNLLDTAYTVDLGGGVVKLGTPLLVQTGVRFEL